ncbi:MAG: hypothetical protein IPJ65_42110 [Archangiaceae bacterium]|nr:hypothetical protein [Archangiaceae bacterium]
MWQVFALIAVSTLPERQLPRRVEKTQLERKDGSDVIAALPELRRAPEQGCWKQAELSGFNLSPASFASDGTRQGPWSVSPRPTGAGVKFSVSIVKQGPAGVTVAVKDSHGVEAGRFSTTNDAPVDAVEVSPDGKLVLYFVSVTWGDIARYHLWVQRRGSAPEKLGQDPVAFVSLSPDLRYALLEGNELVDLARWTSTHLENMPEGQLEPVAWSCDGRALVVVSTESWLEPAWAVKWKVSDLTRSRPRAR